jgi:hypothetical protein
LVTFSAKRAYFMGWAAAARTMPWWRGWAPIIFLPVAVLLLTPAEWPRWLFMWLLALAIYAGCKWLTWRRTPVPGLPWWQHAGYLFAWPGLDARAFLRPILPTQLRHPAGKEWAFACFKLAFGAAIFWGGSRLVPDGWDILRGWVGMVGLIFLLHFGAFHLLSCSWRAAGVEARPLMNNPVASVSVGEFWGRRWNTAFRDLTHRFLFRPLTGKLGPRGAVLAGFLFSGVLHDLVISVPADGGYGGPTIFFFWQGLALLLERSRFGRAIGLGRSWRGWLFTLVSLAAPACLLFHPPFVRNVVLPFMHVLGAG